MWWCISLKIIQKGDRITVLLMLANYYQHHSVFFLGPIADMKKKIILFLVEKSILLMRCLKGMLLVKV